MKPVLEHDSDRRHRDKEPGLLTGVRSICDYTQWGHQTFYKLQKDHGLPAMQLPDGRWCTSKTLIDEWILGRVKAQQQIGQSKTADQGAGARE